MRLAPERELALDDAGWFLAFSAALEIERILDLAASISSLDIISDPSATPLRFFSILLSISSKTPSASFKRLFNSP